MAREETDTNLISAPHILVVDDDERIRGLLARYLLDNGCVVLSAANAQEAKSILNVSEVDLAVLDIMMPGQSGLDLACDLRESGFERPILFLTALGESSDRIAGLEVGADDYLAKPFEPKELLLRIRALLRRTMKKVSHTTAQKVQIGTLTFNTENGALLGEGGQDVFLTDAERELLMMMAKNVGKTLSREDLAAISGVNSARAVDVQITRLRRKIEQGGDAATRYLQTVRGQGYVLRGRPL